MPIYHCHVSVRGFINGPKNRLKKLFSKDDGTYLTPDEAREHLMDELSEGKEVLPFGTACEGFDYKKGCPGHETSNAA